MDIITHTLTGVAVATTVAGFSSRRIKTQVVLILTGAVGGTLPDIDAISLWSRFDSLFGDMFKLQFSGRQIYFKKLWYSHHAFFHSIVAALVFTLIFALMLYFSIRIKNKIKQSKSLTHINHSLLPLVVFFLAYICHLFADIPTPASVWGGIYLLWPVKDYIGGTGQIWWWNNYDIFLIVVSVIIINLIVLNIKVISSFLRAKLVMLIFCCALILTVYQIQTRNFDYAYSGHTARYGEYEKKSKQDQKLILNEWVFTILNKLDALIPFYF